MSRPLRNFDVASLRSVPEVLRALDRELADLGAIAAETDFDNPEHAEQFKRNVLFLKTYYERAEALIRGQYHQPTRPTLGRRAARQSAGAAQAPAS